MKNCRIFGLNGSKNYAAKVANYLDTSVAKHIEEYFDDDESYARSVENVRDCDAYVIAGLYSDAKQKVNEKLVNLMWFIGSLRDASVRRVTAVIPYMAYARQDRKTKSREPITTKYMAQVLEAVGVDRLVTIDIHSLSAYNNANRLPADNLDCVKLFTDYVCGGIGGDGQQIEHHVDSPLWDNSKDLVVLSPDIGGMSRCAVFQSALEKRLQVEIPLAIFDKRRVDGAVTGSRIIGNVKGKRFLLFDDMIASGSTVAKAVEAAERDGGELYAVCATHGLFTGKASENLAKVKRLIISDTIPPWRLKLDEWKDRLHIVPTDRLIAKAIRRTHEEGGSLSDLLTA